MAPPPPGTQSALALLFPPTHPSSAAISALRKENDSRFRTWSAHITLRFPYVPRLALEEAAKGLQSSLASNPFAPFTITLDDIGVFEHKRYSTVFLKPCLESQQLLGELYKLIGGKGEFLPHLSVGQANGEEAVEELAEKAREIVKERVSWRVEGLAVMRRDESGGVVRVWKEIAFGGGEVVTEDEEGGACYGWDGEDWTRAAVRGAILGQGAAKIATYNVLADSDDVAREEPRYAAILSAILAARATAIVLQEVTTHFLEHLLSSPQVRQQYPFTSHPPSTTFASLRNCILLSSVPFAQSCLQFPQRHKSALIARFSDLLLAGVHLSSGLTDPAVQAKAEQMSALTAHLKSNYPEAPWIVAGDFNLVTSERSIELAVAAGAVTLETVALVRDGVIDAGVFVDAWEVAVDEMSGGGRNTKLYPGEAGATFDRLTNQLAAERMEEGRNDRPQRYDRVFIKRGAGITATAIRNFGIEGPGSDHYGVLVQLRLLSSSPFSSYETIQLAEATPSLCFLPPLDFTQQTFELRRRADIIDRLTGLLTTTNLPLRLLPLGSFALGLASTGSDLDLLAVSSISRKTFFPLARQRLQASDIRVLRCVNAVVPMLEVAVSGVKVDLQYSQVPGHMIPHLGDEETDQNTLLAGLPPISVRPINAYRDMQHLLRTVPDLPVFRQAFAMLKLWLKDRGLYVARFGFLGGIHLSLMLSRVAKLLHAQHHHPSPSQLAATFVDYYSRFDWAQRVVSDPDLSPPEYQREKREAMVILAIHTPTVRRNVAQNATRATAETIARVLQLKEQPGSFLDMFGRYLRIEVNFWGVDKRRARALIGVVESRFPLLFVGLPGEVYARLWPNRWCERGDEKQDGGDLRGCYLVGVEMKTDKREKLPWKGICERFEEQLRDTPLFDASEAWVSVDLALPADLSQLVPDVHDWGGDELDPDLGTDPLFDSSGLPAADSEDAPSSPLLPSPPQASKETKKESAGGKGKLRPAQDILSRLRWDPQYNVDDYVVGYLDRFVGTKEIELKKWKTEETHREFVPMHRVVYFRNAKTGERVWDRERRQDRIFG